MGDDTHGPTTIGGGNRRRGGSGGGQSGRGSGSSGGAGCDSPLDGRRTTSGEAPPDGAGGAERQEVSTRTPGELSRPDAALIRGSRCNAGSHHGLQRSVGRDAAEGDRGGVQSRYDIRKPRCLYRPDAVFLNSLSNFRMLLACRKDVSCRHP